MQQSSKDSPGNPDLDAYVAGTATEAEEAKFEEALIANPKLAAELDVRQRIKAGMELLDTRGQLEPLLRKSPAPHWRMALAASVAVALVAAGWLWKSTNHGELVAKGPTLSSSLPAGFKGFDSSVMLARVRGAPEKITVNRAGSLVQLRLLIGDATPDMRIRLDTAASGRAPLPVTTSAQGFTLVYLDTTGLDPGVHKLVLSAGGQDVETFEFDLAFRE